MNMWPTIGHLSRSRNPTPDSSGTKSTIMSAARCPKSRSPTNTVSASTVMMPRVYRHVKPGLFTSETMERLSSTPPSAAATRCASKRARMRTSSTSTMRSTSLKSALFARTYWTEAGRSRVVSMLARPA